MIIFIMIIMLSSIMIIMTMMISKNIYKFQETLSPYECGFDPFSTPRIPFSLRFFLISVIFLIFDVEIALILPIPMSMNSPLSLTFMFSFLMILLLGLFYEWKNGILSWL
uniref:NADH-ubiquinone oxidoreductase chain 3 n=1 Tax=Songthela hangzhouensis TaxID=1649374 RepID=Q6JT39_9ARAC|nr:NADH dehydrogenase subunit 3 [Songthela hangzhouensis]AAP51139.1 NADH dehydrogenase subunit 3 [Songthela hangzhouensis]